jgi:hypothetical protein
MQEMITWHVAPRGDGTWLLRKDGAVRASGKFESKADALDSARVGGKAVVYVHDRDGSIERKHVYAGGLTPSGRN